MSSTFFIRVLFFCFFSLTMLHARLLKKGCCFAQIDLLSFRRSRCRRSFVTFPLALTKLASFRFKKLTSKLSKQFTNEQYIF